MYIYLYPLSERYGWDIECLGCLGVSDTQYPMSVSVSWDTEASDIECPETPRHSIGLRSNTYQMGFDSLVPA